MSSVKIKAFRRSAVRLTSEADQLRMTFKSFARTMVQMYDNPAAELGVWADRVEAAVAGAPDNELLLVYLDLARAATHYAIGDGLKALCDEAVEELKNGE